MVLEKLFGGISELEGDQYIELDTESGDAQAGKVPIKIDKLEDFADADRIQKSLRNGAVVLVKIKSLKEKDLTELKRAIEKLRKTCVAMSGDIVGIDEDWIVVTPQYAHVARE
jgi:uncharacterized protein